MTGRELKELASHIDDNAEVVFRPTNCDYVYNISADVDREEHHIRAFWGSDYKAIVICADDQVGADWGVDVEYPDD